jgi:hypothetical protein
VKNVLLIICGIQAKTLEVKLVLCFMCVDKCLVQSYEVTLYFASHMFLLNEGIVS